MNMTICSMTSPRKLFLFVYTSLYPLNLSFGRGDWDQTSVHGSSFFLRWVVWYCNWRDSASIIPLYTDPHNSGPCPFSTCVPLLVKAWYGSEGDAFSSPPFCNLPGYMLKEGTGMGFWGYLALFFYFLHGVPPKNPNQIQRVWYRISEEFVPLLKWLRICSNISEWG